MLQINFSLKKRTRTIIYLIYFLRVQGCFFFFFDQIIHFLMLAHTQMLEKLMRISRLNFQGSAGQWAREVLFRVWHWEITKHLTSSKL